MELLPDPPDGSERINLRHALCWARDGPEGGLYTVHIFSAVPTAEDISAMRARMDAGEVVNPEYRKVANTNTSREDVASWFVQEAMRLTGWMAHGTGPVFVESPGAAAFVGSLSVSQYRQLLDATCHAARHPHYCPRSGIMDMENIPVYLIS